MNLCIIHDIQSNNIQNQQLLLSWKYVNKQILFKVIKTMSDSSELWIVYYIVKQLFKKPIFFNIDKRRIVMQFSLLFLVLLCLVIFVSCIDLTEEFLCSYHLKLKIVHVFVEMDVRGKNNFLFYFCFILLPWVIFVINIF